MSRRLVWGPMPSSRLLQVFDRRRRSRGCWAYTDAGLSAARAEAAKRRGSTVLVIDEYAAKLPHLGHVYRVVVGELSS